MVISNVIVCQLLTMMEFHLFAAPLPHASLPSEMYIKKMCLKTSMNKVLNHIPF
jgi:hypothetical protein